MDGLCNTSQTLCTRCRLVPRLTGQRWCRQCLTAAQRDRRAAQRAARSEAVSMPVTPAVLQAIPLITQASAPVRPEAEQGLTEALQVPLSPGAAPPAGLSVGVTHAQRQALLAYCIAVQEYEARRRIDRGWMPMDRSTVLVPLWQKVKAAQRRCHALGVDPEQDRR
jgi:hypothetical protein